MKKYIPFLTITAAAALLIFSCKKEYTNAAKTTDATSMAHLLIIDASPRFDSIYHHDSLNVYAGADKINAGLLGFGSVYPATGSYAALTAGPQSIRLSVNAPSNSDSTVVSFDKTLEAGKYYTLFITDSISSPRDSSKIWLQDNFPNPTAGPGTFYLRFMHAVMDGFTDTVDLYSSRRNQVLFSKIKRDSTTAFVGFSTILNSQDTLYVRKTGTGTILAKIAAVSFGDQQIYTAYYLGDTAINPVSRARSIGVWRNK